MIRRYAMTATIPVGPRDEGAEVDCRITFNYTPGHPEVRYLRNGDPGYPAEPAEVEFVSAEPWCNGKPSPFDGAFADLQHKQLQEIAADWLADHEDEALDHVAGEDDRAREYAAELRRET